MSQHDLVLEIIRLKSQAPLAIEPGSTALIFVDVQRNFTRPECPFGQALERLVPGVTAAYFERVRNTILPSAQRLQQWARSSGVPIFYTATGSLVPGGGDLCAWLKEFDGIGMKLLGKAVWPTPNDEAWQIDESIAPAPGEVVLNKTSSSAFNATMLDQALRGMGIKSLIVCGLSTDVCVSSTARSAADLGYGVVVVEDACATISEPMHRASLEAIGLAFGRVWKTEQVVSLFPPVKQVVSA